MLTFDCDGCGELEYVLVDGYPVGDRLLEGVMFKYFPDGHIEISEDDADYFSNLNEEKWIGAMEESVADYYDIAQCSKCFSDVDLDEE